MNDTLCRADYSFLQAFLRERIGHDLGEGKEYLALSRLTPLAEDLNFSGISALLNRIRESRCPTIDDAVCEAMVTCETSFFRNPSAFERLRLSVIPFFMKARHTERRLRIWCAGCSTGQEPYSLGILLVEHFPELRSWDIQILATDLSDRVLRQAKSGEYSEQEIRRGLSEHRIQAYFTKTKNRWVIDPSVRRLIQFEKQNLVSTRLMSVEFDLILIRNVLIYFTSEIRMRIFASIRESIRDDGFLFLGDSETILGQSTAFTFAEDGMDFFRPRPG